MKTRKEDVVLCQFHQWFPKFRHCTISSEIIPFPPKFIDYILEDGVFLPNFSNAIPSRSVQHRKTSFYDSDVDDEDFFNGQENTYSKWNEEEDTSEEPQIPHFPDFEDSIRNSMEKLGGCVFPKCNWSAPKDAVWLSPNKNLKCENMDQIFLFLKSSDDIVHDICHAFDECIPIKTNEDIVVTDKNISIAGDDDGDNNDVDDSNDDASNNKHAEEDRIRNKNDENNDENKRLPPMDYFLVLRKWTPISPQSEFRCFVRKKRLIGICQRNACECFPSLAEKEKEKEIKETISRFYCNQIMDNFDAENYVFDVCMKTGKVVLIDFNPYGNPTNPILFSWEDLEQIYTHGLAEKPWIASEKQNASLRIRNEMREESAVEGKRVCSDDVEFRIMTSSSHSLFPSYNTYYGVPYDLIDVNPGGAIDEFLKKAMERAEEND